MKVVILCGGRGTRISEATESIPKPMIEIGGKPILWHIMKIYSSFGFNDFVLCLGYRGYVIKEYFSHYFLHMSDVTIDMNENKMEIHTTASEPWKVTMVDTGINTMTGGRLKRIKKYIGNETFMMTYGDGVADIDIAKLVSMHKKNKKLATLTAVQSAGRFGVLDIQKDSVNRFLEKPKGENSRINAGFFVLEPEVFKYIRKGDDTIWERNPLESLAKDQQLGVYKHNGFWKCMDTLRDKIELEEMIDNQDAPWQIR
ncbi:MAG: glucose-1-phosphate cytidylyltransferase [Candidatus Omnitrophica bacterium]|nr:glucose-1-phosphate cytidylyltransferase [Candidatus Omnitrophota bacterium]